MQVNFALLAIFLGILSTLMMNLGKGTSKYGLKKMAEKKDKKKKFMMIWIFGMIFTAINVVPYYFAVGFGDASVVNALAGVGLISLVFFSYLVLDEKLDTIVYVGIGFTILGTVLLGIFSQKTEQTFINFPIYLILFASCLTPLVISIIYSYTHDFIFFGFLFGTMAGMLSGFATVLMKMGQILNGSAQNLFVNLLSIGNMSIYLAIILALVATGFTQFGLTKGKASIVVPAYNSMYIIIPLTCEMLVFITMLSAQQLIGIVIILIGIILMTAFKPEPLDSSILDKEKQN
ncbi:MAG: hypothetical protein ACTSX4_09390 [Candidatus Helarchaeota archaeon]